MSLPYNYIGSIASNQTQEFFRPKTTFEKIQLVLSLSWFIIAFLASPDLQAYLFCMIIILFLINFTYLTIFNKPQSSFLNTVLKFGFFFFLFILLRPSAQFDIILSSYIIKNVILLQKSILAGLIIIGLFFKFIRLQLLKPSSKMKVFEDYFDFIFQLFKGLSYSIFLYVLFDLINWVPNLATSVNKFPNVQDILLIIGSLLLIISSQGPEGADLKKLFVQELFLVSQTRFERLRDAILKVSIFLLFLIDVLPYFTPHNQTIVSAQDWTNVATVLFVIGIITFVLALFENKGNNNSSFSKFANNFSDKVNGPLPEKLNFVKQAVSDAKIEPEKQQFFKLTDDIPIINKENTKFIAKKNSIAIPVKETPQGTAVVFVGDSDIENLTDKGAMVKQSLEELATTVMIPNDIWDKVNLSLEVFKPSDETIKALTLKGIESKEKLLSLAQSSLTEFKNLTSSQQFVTKFQGMVDNYRQGKYFVSDTKKGTFVRLPGITVIDNDDATFVRVFGIKVLEAQGHTVVNMPFIKVIETPEYQLVNIPGIHVIEAGNSNLVNLAGFQILDGDPKQIEEAKLKIQNQSTQLDTAFSQLENRVDKIVSNPDNFLLARNASGKTINLLTSESSDSALINTNLLPMPKESKSFSLNSSQTKKERKRSKVKADKKVSIMEFKGQRKTGPKFILKESEAPTNKPPSQPINKKDKLEKLYRIAKMSHSSIELSRLAGLLEFSSVNELEKWLVDLNINDLQINWEENKLLINENVVNGLEEALKKLE